MASINNIYFKLETLRTIVSTLEKKGEKGVSIDISVNDEENQYNQNVSAWIAQTKEQREAKAPKFYVANGRCVWSDGKPPLVVKFRENVGGFAVVTDAEIVKEAGNDNGLPF